MFDFSSSSFAISYGVFFPTQQELLDLYPALSPKEREDAFLKEHGTALIMQIGGGIGQSRLCMLLLGRAHIGEVQSSIWDSKTVEKCREAGVVLL